MEGETSHTGKAGHRAVLWHAPEALPPPTLLAALAGRGIETDRVQSPYRALAELCRAGKGSAPAIVIVHPESLADVPAFWEAKARYAPGARCWMYGPAAEPLLRAITEADIAAWAGPGQPQVVVKPKAPQDPLRIGPQREAVRPRAAAPRLKLTGESTALPAEADEGAKAPLLTAEELRMLLGDDEPGAARNR